MNIRIMIPLSLLFFCFSCGKQKTNQTDIVRPVKVYQVESLSHVDKDFAGLSTADSLSNLAFRISGQLIKLNVIEGQNVRKGDVIAEIDPRQYQLQFDAAKAEYLTMQSQIERNKRLLAKQAISLQDYEIAQANYAQVQSAYTNAQSMLADTKLKAPFPGTIEKKYVENYQQVQPGQEIVRLVNPVTQTVKFTMPETSLETLKLPNKQFSVIFDSYKNVQFPAHIREYVQTSTQVAGITVTLTLDKIGAQYNIVPGMSCTINMKVDNPGYENVTAVPITAVFSTDSQNMVWVVENSKTVLRKVTLGELFGNDMIIIERGLKPGDWVVTAGVYQLTADKKVKILN